MRDRIFLVGLEFYGFHGVPAEERALGHRYRVDAELYLDLRTAGQADDFTATIDYGAAAQRLLAVGMGPAVQLLETLAERMAADLLAWDERIQAVRVRVRKLNPPVPVVLAAAGVEVYRTRDSEGRGRGAT